MDYKILYVTGNKGKFMEVSARFEKYGLEVIAPEDFGLKADIPETGKTLEDNAALKVRMFRVKLEILRSKGENIGQIVLMADDTGLSIDALGGEPGVKTRRWKDGITDMSDVELVDYCLERMQQIPPEARTAEFRTVVSLLYPPIKQDSEGDIDFYNGRLRGIIVEKPMNKKISGLPFDSIFYIPDWEIMLADVYTLSDEEKAGRFTHREIAVDKALEAVLKWFAKQELVQS